MKKIIFSTLLILAAFFSFSQDTVPMRDDVSVPLTLTSVEFAQVDGVRHIDLLGSSDKYYVKLLFGKRKFDLELFESATGKRMWATYSLLKTGDQFFKLDKAKSNGLIDVYTMNYTEGKKTYQYEVKFNAVRNIVSVDYSVKTQSSKEAFGVIASGSY